MHTDFDSCVEMDREKEKGHSKQRNSTEEIPEADTTKYGLHHL